MAKEAWLHRRVWLQLLASTLCAVAGSPVPPVPGAGCSKYVPDPKAAHRSLAVGFVTGSFDGLTLAQCCEACANQTQSPKILLASPCEAWAWEMSKKERLEVADFPDEAVGKCELRQLTGTGKIVELGDTSGVSWKRHANFKGDCTPLWVDIGNPDMNVKKDPLKFTGTQQERDLACCRACTAEPACEAWSQAMDIDDDHPEDSQRCWLRTLTQPEKPGHRAVIVGAGDRDTDFPAKKPKPYFSERRMMVCEDVVATERRPCGAGATQADVCQSFGCCWDAKQGMCFRSKWRPVAIMHGMGSRLVEYEKNILWLRQAYPGIFVVSLNVYPGPPSQLTHMEPQMARIKKTVAAIPMLQHGFNFYGESQGGLEARVYVSLFNEPPVFNLVAISGPQAGVGLCPEVDIPVIKEICAGGAPIIGIYKWPRCSFCDYWKGTDEKQYLVQSQWLAQVNNDRPTKNASFQTKMASLNLYMASAGSDDKVVQPRESAWHTFWPWGGPKTQVVDWRQTESYNGDWLGLRTLDAAGKLIFNMYEGGHTKYNSSWWLATVLPLFNNTLDDRLLAPAVGVEKAVGTPGVAVVYV